jgi:hypothetical protein
MSRIICHFWICLCSILVLLCGVVWGDGVNFFSSGSGQHVKSDMQLLGSDALVELGAFVPTFTPTVQNRASWRTNWRGLKRVRYDAASQFFSGAVTLTNNDSPFTTSNQIWVWIFDRSGQWCLYSNTNWLWPSAAPGPSFPIDVSPAGASVSLAGTASASTPRVRCELVSDAAGPVVTYEEEAEILLPAGLRGAHQDADGDGQSNWFEYAFGSDPMNRNSTAQVVAVRNYGGQPYLSAQINRGWTSGVQYQVQWSTDLSNWQTTGMTSVVDNLRLLEIRESQPVGANAKRFMRVRITSP